MGLAVTSMAFNDTGIHWELFCSTASRLNLNEAKKTFSPKVSVPKDTQHTVPNQWTVLLHSCVFESPQEIFGFLSIIWHQLWDREIIKMITYIWWIFLGNVGEYVWWMLPRNKDLAILLVPLFGMFKWPPTFGDEKVTKWITGGGRLQGFGSMVRSLQQDWPGVFEFKSPTWMSQEVSKWSVSGL